MRRPIIPALVCLAALGCSHRHLILNQAPLGTRALADRVSSGWRITLLVQGLGWEASSPEEPLALDQKDAGGRTQIEWTVPIQRWNKDRDYYLILKKGDQKVAVVVQNRSREGKVTVGVAVAAVVVGIVVLAIASSHGNGSGHHSSQGGKSSGHAGHPKGTDGGHSAHTPILTIQPTLPNADPSLTMDPSVDPLVTVEPFGGGAFPVLLSASLRPLPEGWEVEVGLRSLPESEIWSVTGEGFEVTETRAGHDLFATWITSKAVLKNRQFFYLKIQGPDRIYHACVSLE